MKVAICAVESYPGYRLKDNEHVDIHLKVNTSAVTHHSPSFLMKKLFMHTSFRVHSSIAVFCCLSTEVNDSLMSFHLLLRTFQINVAHSI